MTTASGIYSITSPSQKRYVGSAVNIRSRWHGHRTALRTGRHKNRHLQSAWDKYGEAEMVFAPLLICSPENLLMYEQAAIDALKPEYNISPVAGNCLGVKRSPETCAKLSKRLAGRSLTPEHKAAISAGLRGRVCAPETRAKLADQRGWRHTDDAKAKMRRQFSEEHKQKLRALAIGRPPIRTGPHSDETKRKISEANKGRKLSDETRARMRAAAARRRAS